MQWQVRVPVDLDTLRLRSEIESIYRRVAIEPAGDFHFHGGPTYAADMLGYDADALARLPPDSTASFAGVANPHRIAPMTAGATVVDIGCGVLGWTCCWRPRLSGQMVVRLAWI